VASGTAASGLYASNLNGSLLSVQYRTNRQVTLVVADAEIALPFRRLKVLVR
jgi:hypothetical protein